MVGLLRQAHRLRRGNVFYFRIAVPIKLQSVLGHEYKRSLKTGDLRIANHICRIMSNKAEGFFNMVLANTPTDKDMKQLMRTYFESQLDKAMADYSDARAMCLTSEEEEPSYDPYGFISVTNDKYKLLKELSAMDDYTDEQQETASEMLRQRDFECIVNSDFLATQLMQASIEAKRIELAYHQRNPSDVTIQHPFLKGCRNVFENPNLKTFTVRECINLYIEYKADTIREKSLKGIQGYLNCLCNILGDEKSIHTIRKHPDGILLERIVKQIPAHYTRDYKSKNIDIMDLVSGSTEYTKIGHQTASNHWTYFQDFFKWAVDRDYIEHNPIEGMKPKFQQPLEEDGREEWAIEKLQSLFNSPIYSGRKHIKSALWKKGKIKIKDGHFWLPLIGLYTGMREAEILQITPKDIKETEGIMYFDINRLNKKSTKNDQSRRYVPIHDELVKIGLKQYVAKRRKDISDTDEIFADNIVIPENKEITANYSRTFSGYTIKIGLRDSANNIEVFHSFRHNLITALGKAGVTNVMAAWISGHKPPKETQTIGDTVYLHNKPDIKKLHEIINKAHYDIDLNHLYE